MATLTLKDFQYSNRGPLNLEIKAGECICITGASGSGKSLLLRSIADLDTHQGAALLNGQEANSMPANEWRKKVGMLPAESRWWFDIVGDHFPEQDHSLLNHLGFNSGVFDWETNRLSTGEKQRLAIGRLLVQKPMAILLDEPTANLDASNAEKIETLILNYISENECPCIWISHDLSQVNRVADRHFVLIKKTWEEQNLCR